MTPEVWHRYEDKSYATRVDPWSDDDNWTSVRVLEHKLFPVLSHTPKGVWLDLGWGTKRFARVDARKRFACPTRREALESFIARKEKQAQIYENRAKDARLMILEANLHISRLP